MTGRQDEGVARPTLRTARIELVPLADDHPELEVQLDSDPDVLRYLYDRARTRAEVEESHRRRNRCQRSACVQFVGPEADR